jgi:APA family basic amino acid/polyamine antiporter
MDSVVTPQPVTDRGAPGPSFQRQLSLFDATMLVAGTMIGSGIFIVSAEMARDLGSTGWLLAVWALTGVMTVIGALSYAELAAMMPQAGGQYIFLREAYSPLWGFLYGWTCFLVIQTGSIAAVGVAFAKYLGELSPDLGTTNVLFIKDLHVSLTLPWMAEPFFQRDKFTISAGQLVAVVIVLFLSLWNCLGVREGKLVQNVFTVAKTMALMVLIVVGLTLARNVTAVEANTKDWWEGATQTGSFQQALKKLPGALTDLPTGVALAILMVAGGAMVGSLFSADAWNNVTFTAGEVKNPRRNLARSMALGTGMVIILYLLANFAYLAALPVRGDADLAKKLAQEAKAAETPGAKAEVEKKYAESAFQLGIDHANDDRVATAVMELGSPRFGVSFMAVAIMISTFGCVNGMTLMGARLYYAMAQDNLFFASVGRLNQRGVPAAGLILQGVWSILLIFSGTYNELLDYVMFAALLFYVLTVVGLFVLRRKQPAAERPYRAFGYPIIPGIYVLLCALIMLDLLIVKPKFTWPGLIIVLAGIPVYFLWRLLQRSPVARG